MPDTRINSEFLAAVRGDAPADLLLRGGRVVNVFTKEIEEVSIAVHGSRISSIGHDVLAKHIIELNNAYVAPGLIDAHMHVESTMMLPSQFANVAVPHGTTGAIFDPHEIANVAGMDGIRYLMDESDNLPMNIMFTAPSCVPGSMLETSGATIGHDDLLELLQHDRVVALAEMMDAQSVINADPVVLQKVHLGLRYRIVDGHSPSLTGLPLQTYIAAGISSDHECTSHEEAIERIRLGMRVFLREGSAAQNLEALASVVTNNNAHRFCFCTDDRHPVDLINEGHIDHVVRKAIRLGIDPVTALAMASLHTAEHYQLPNIGAIAPGYHADIIIFTDLKSPRPDAVYYHGKLTAQNGSMIEPIPTSAIDAMPFQRSVCLPNTLTEQSFNIPVSVPNARIRVIGMDPHNLISTAQTATPEVSESKYISDTKHDILKIAVIERHKGTGNIGLGFVHGFGIKNGAIASTVAHDAHNITVIGTSDRDMYAAVCELEMAGGGQCVVCDGKLKAILPLPIAGLISNMTANDLATQQEKLLQAANSIGSIPQDPFMPLSFLSLTVIPTLKLSDQGLVDVDAFKIVPLELSE